MESATTHHGIGKRALAACVALAWLLAGAAASADERFEDLGDGTVADHETGLVWQKSPDSDGDGNIDARDKKTLAQALADAGRLHLGGHDDWRLPTVTELYSLIDFDGVDPGGHVSGYTEGIRPFIDTRYFDFAWGDTARGERIIDAQYLSRTRYVATTGPRHAATVFGVNFADGRIKGYPLQRRGSENTFFVRYVRGSSPISQTDLVDNGDGTVTDRSSGLMWARDDSARGLDWNQAQDWIAELNAEGYLGYRDWRLPKARELQRLVDYERAPDTTGSAAIDPLFHVTSIVNEAGQRDFPAYWTATTHANTGPRADGAAVYVAFGRAMGFMGGAWVDAHGAGAQRSDPKTGDPARFPQGRGPQGDAIRIFNFVRPVRTIETPGLAPNH